MKTAFVVLSAGILATSFVAAATSAPAMQTPESTIVPAQTKAPLVRVPGVAKTTKNGSTEPESLDVLTSAAAHDGDDWLVIPSRSLAVQAVKIKKEGVVERVTLRTAVKAGAVVLIVNDVVYTENVVTRTAEGHLSASFETHELSLKKDDAVFVGLFVSADAPSVKLGCDAAGAYTDGDAYLVRYKNDDDEGEKYFIDGADLAFNVTVRQSRALRDDAAKRGFFASLKFWK